MSITHPIHLNGVTGGAVNISPCSSRSDVKRVLQIKFLSLNCASRSMSCVCNASSGSYRRNPDFPKQNKQQGFSRSRNRNFEERDGSDNLEDSEIFSSKNGALHSVSGSSKYQATAAPGPREKEIVELFRKVQAQLRERAAIKEEKKNEELPQVQVKKSETVDSLLKLLRKHSVQQGKRDNDSSSSSRDFILDQPELNGLFSTGKSSSFFKLNNDEKNKVQGSEASSVGRPMSSFRRRSPVPQFRKQPTYVDEDTNSVTDTYQEGKQKDTSYLEHEVEHKPILKLKVDPVVRDDSRVESDSAFPDGDLFDEISDGETTETDDGISDEDADEQNLSKDIDLSGMKLVELRALAKSRGMKGFSKLKKQDLIQLLAEDSV